MTASRSSRRVWLGRIVAGTVFAAGAVAVTQHAVVEHQKARTARETIAKLMTGLASLRSTARTDVHASLNGVMSHLTFTSAPQAPSDAAAAVADACGKDAETGGADVVATGDSPNKRFVREAVHRDDSRDGSASSVLCVFRSADTGERFERFTFVRGDEKGSSLTSLTRQSKADLAQMFPIDGDAPGDDLAGVPRPEGSRRVVAASVIETGHAVRIYEVARGSEASDDLRVRREAFDQQMRAAGYQPSAAVAAALDDTRLYLRGTDRIVVAFEPAVDGTRIAINRTDLL